MKITITPSRIHGEAAVPGSKSHTIRGLFIAAAADGESVLRKPLFSEDTKACIAVCRAFGARIEENTEYLRVFGIGKRNICFERTVREQRRNDICCTS